MRAEELFKKSEHEEVMDAIGKLRKEVKKINGELVYIPPQVPYCPRCPYNTNPYVWDTNWGQWTYADGVSDVPYNYGCWTV